MTTTVSVRGQTVIPSALRKRYHIRTHTELVWVDTGRTLCVYPVPEDPIKALRGQFRDVDLLTGLLADRHEERARARQGKDG